MATVYKFRPVQLAGRKLRQLRKERRLTQTELSSRIGIQQSDLSRMEKGEYRVSLDALFRILGEFQVSIGEFFDQMAREALSDKDLRLVHQLHRLDEQGRSEVEQLIATKSRDLPAEPSSTRLDEHKRGRKSSTKPPARPSAQLSAKPSARPSAQRRPSATDDLARA